MQTHIVQLLFEEHGANPNIEDNLGNIWFSVDKDFGVLEIKEEGVFNKLQIAYFNQIQEDLVDGYEHIYTFDQNNVFIGTKIA